MNKIALKLNTILFISKVVVIGKFNLNSVLIVTVRNLSVIGIHGYNISYVYIQKSSRSPGMSITHSGDVGTRRCAYLRGEL